MHGQEALLDNTGAWQQARGLTMPRPRQAANAANPQPHRPRLAGTPSLDRTTPTGHAHGRLDGVGTRLLLAMPVLHRGCHRVNLDPATHPPQSEPCDPWPRNPVARAGFLDTTVWRSTGLHRS
eukprot:1846038-Alexandrium_andersonii.AAC.2